jgi:hypothetical protein
MERDPNRGDWRRLWMLLPVAVLLIVGASLLQTGPGGVSVQPLGADAASDSGAPRVDLTVAFPVYTAVCYSCYLTPTATPTCVPYCLIQATMISCLACLSSVTATPTATATPSPTATSTSTATATTAPTSSPTSTPTPSATSTPTPSPTLASGPATGGGTPVGSGMPVSYASGWNIVGGPTGTLILGAIGPMYTYQAGDTAYETIGNGTPLTQPQGYWAYMGATTGGSIPVSGPQTLTVALPPGQWVMIGNPGNTPANVSGADVVYTYSATNGYQPTTTLQPGQGGWAISVNGGTATIANS